MARSPMRGVFERPPGSGVWWINYYDAAGKRHREPIGRYNIAVEAYLQRRQEVREGRFSPPRASAGLTFRELADLAIANKKLRNSPASVKMDEFYSRRLCKEFGDTPASKVTSALVEETIQKLREAGLSGSTLNRYRSFISSVYSFAIRTGRAVENPCRRVAKLRENESRIRFLVDDEEKRLRKVIHDFYPEKEAELDLALYTGIRRGEQWALRREDVDLERGTLTIAKGKSGRRHVPISSAARDALEFLLKFSNGSELIIRTRQRHGGRDGRRWFEWCVGEAKISDFTWHDLRHTFASRLVMAGVDLRTVQELMGHKSILVTQRYAHLAPSHKQAAIEKIVPAKPKGHVRVLRIVSRKNG